MTCSDMLGKGTPNDELSALQFPMAWMRLHTSLMLVISQQTAGYSAVILLDWAEPLRNLH